MKIKVLLFSIFAINSANAFELLPFEVTCQMHKQGQITCEGIDQHLFYIFSSGVDIHPGEKLKLSLTSAVSYYRPHQMDNFMYVNYSAHNSWIKFKSTSSNIVPVITHENWKEHSPHQYVCRTTMPTLPYCPISIE